MHNRSSWVLLICVLATVAGFILYTGRSLPAVVASHFSASGHANAWMPSSAYLVLMVALSVGIPFIVVFLHVWIIRSASSLNIPNREMWLAPEQRASTRQFLITQAIRFSALISLFMGYAHWLVVRGNSFQPARLEVAPFLAGLGLFLALTVAWILAFVIRFVRKP